MKIKYDKTLESLYTIFKPKLLELPLYSDYKTAYSAFLADGFVKDYNDKIGFYRAGFEMLTEEINWFFFRWDQSLRKMHRMAAVISPLEIEAYKDNNLCIEKLEHKVKWLAEEKNVFPIVVSECGYRFNLPEGIFGYCPIIGNDTSVHKTVNRINRSKFDTEKFRNELMRVNNELYPKNNSQLSGCGEDGV
jgi:hypothetical protein